MRNAWSGSRVGARLALSLLTGVVAAALAGSATARALNGVGEAATAAVVIAEVYACILVALGLAFGRDRAMRERVLALRRPSSRAFVLGLGVWIGAYIAAGVAYVAAAAVGVASNTIFDILLGVGADGGRLSDASLSLAAIILLRVCVLVPFAEELLFRGALYTWLRERLSAGWTIGITATAFGVMHQIPVFIPLAIIVGIGAGWIRERTGSVLVPVALHAVQNVLIVVVSLAATGWEATLPLG